MVISRLFDRVLGRKRPEFDPRLVRKLQSGSYLEGGYTNTILSTGDDTVVKFFRRHPITAFYYSLFELCALHRLHYFHRNERIENEVTVSRALQDSELTPPTIYHRGNIGIEMERVDGISMKEYLDHATPGAANYLGAQMGHMLSSLYDDGICLRDCQLRNFLVDEHGTIHSIDHEYGTSAPRSGDHHYTVATLLSSARHLEHTRYSAFRQGFLETYRPAQDDRTLTRMLRDVVIGLVAVYQGIVREGNPERTQRAAYNSARDFSTAVKAMLPLP